MRRTMVLVLVAALLAIAAVAARANPLEAELVGLLMDHPQIQAAEKDVQSKRDEIDKASAEFWPSVSITADAGPEVIDSPSTRAADLDPRSFERTLNVATVSVNQNLFNGFSTSATVKTAQLNREISQITLEGTRQNTLFEGINAYINVLRQKRLVELARTNEGTIQRQLQLEDERVRRGSGVAVDVLQAKSRLQIAKERRVSFEGALEDAVSRYRQVFGHAPDIERMMDPVPPIGLIPSDLKNVLRVALAENPAVINSGTTVEVARERQRTVRSELFPSVDLEGTYNYEKHNNAVIGTRRDYSVLLRATWDLFTGFSTRAGLSQAAFDYRASKDTHRFVSRRVVEQGRLAWQAVITARQRLELLENAVNIASEVFDSREKLREAGKETVINVLDAENEVNSAQINYTGAAYDERVAVYQVLLAMGRLNPRYLDIQWD